MLFYRFRKWNRSRRIRNRHQSHRQQWNRHVTRLTVHHHRTGHKLERWNNSHLYHFRQHLVLSVIISIVGIIAIVYGANFLNDEIAYHHNSYRGTASITAQSQLRQHRPVSVLIMGADHGAFGYHNHWTGEIMLNTVNPARDSMQLTSVPRGAMVNGQTADTLDERYGNDGARQRLQNWLHTPIPYYMILNMHGLQKVVNEVGGVRVDPPLNIEYDQLHLKKDHPARLDGHQAMDYCLMIDQDPRGDYGRQLRQRQVLFQLFYQTATVRNLVRHPGLAKELSKHVKTNLSLFNLIQLAAHYRSSDQHLTSNSLLDGNHRRVRNHEQVHIPITEQHRRVKQVNQLLK